MSISAMQLPRSYHTSLGPIKISKKKKRKTNAVICIRARRYLILENRVVAAVAPAVVHFEIFYKLLNFASSMVIINNLIDRRRCQVSLLYFHRFSPALCSADST